MLTSKLDNLSKSEREEGEASPKRIYHDWKHISNNRADVHDMDPLAADGENDTVSDLSHSFYQYISFVSSGLY